MKQLNNMPYLLLRQDLLMRVQMLAARYPQTGINPDGLFCFSDEDLTGIYAHFKRLDELDDAEK